MLIRRVIDHELDEYADPAIVRGFHEGLEIVHGAVRRVDRTVIGDIVTVVAHRRGEERQEPDARRTEILDVVEFLGQPGEIAHAVVVRVVERFDVDLIDDGIFEPERIGIVHER